MNSPRWQLRSPVAVALLCSAAIGAQYVSGKVVRNTLFLDVFDGKTALPWMTQATSLFSIFLVFLTAKTSKRVSPASYVPVAFALSALLLMVCWATVTVSPRTAAVIVYLQVSGLGPVLGSGFWLLTSERLDPRAAKRRFGLIAGAGTLGGLLTTFVPTPSAVALLPILAGLNMLCALGVWQLGRAGSVSQSSPRASAKAAEPPVSGWKVLRSAPYLMNLAVLVLLGTIGAIVVDYLFMTEVSATLGKNKLAFFKIYYPAVNTITFLLQTLGARFVLEQFGIAAATCLPSLTLFVGSIASLAVPGLRGLVAVRGGESVFRGSLYRSGYEVFFTPVPPREKRAVKSTIDVGFDRLGDFIGAGFMQLVLFLPVGQRTSALLLLVLVCAAGGLFIASRLRRGYQEALEHSLTVRGEELELPQVEDRLTRTVLLKTMRVSSGTTTQSHETTRAATAESDPVVNEILALRSNDAATIRRVLRREKGLPAVLVPHVIPLLAWDEVAPECVRALRSVAEERVGALIDALLDPNQPFVVRRRLARVFFVCVSQRAADGLLLGLEDGSFEVRYQSGRSLLSIVEKNPRVRIDQQRVFAITEKEVAVSVDVWKKRQFLDEPEAGDARSFLEEVIRDRASQALAHVFTLLALVLPTEPVRIAFHGLHATDQNLRGTALDYLDTVVPPAIKKPLWPFLEDRRPTAANRAARPSDDALADLLKSHQSIMLNLEALRKRAGGGAAPGASPLPSEG